MKVSFLGQGFDGRSDNAVGHYLMKFLSESDFYSFIGTSAFASEAGIYGLSEYFKTAKKVFSSLTLIVGIDQEGTSKEALTELLNLNINSFVFYQSEPPIFHPKIYLFEGLDKFKLIIGSSNLTQRGLFNNVESSILVESDMDDEDGLNLLTELKNYYKSLFDFSDKNLFKINDSLIDDLYSKGLIPDELTRRAIYSKTSSNIKLKAGLAVSSLIVPKRAVAKIPTYFKRKTRIFQAIEEVTGTEIEYPKLVSDISEFQALWKSGPLTQRDLNIPTGANTNPTGSMLFKKGQSEGIDQRHYFRDVVFSKLPWVLDTNERTNHLERATASFRFIVAGVDKGAFPLLLTHNTDKESRSYLQNNSMTSLSWGSAKQLIAKEELIGKSATLYRDKTNPNEFILNIE